MSLEYKGPNLEGFEAVIIIYVIFLCFILSNYHKKGKNKNMLLM